MYEQCLAIRAAGDISCPRKEQNLKVTDSSSALVVPSSLVVRRSTSLKIAQRMKTVQRELLKPSSREDGGQASHFGRIACREESRSLD